MRAFRFITLFILPVLLFSCFKVDSKYKAEDLGYKSPDKTLKVWLLADIQPTNDRHKYAFEFALFDINENVPNIDFAIVAGDIVNETEGEIYDWYIKTKSKSYIHEWYEIAGNHDLKSDNGILFKEKLQDSFNYTIEKGNILFIFMSDEGRGKPTIISDETFNWWKDIVINNQDKIIVVVTHAPLEGSNLPFSSFKARKILDSQRFSEVLKDYKVDLWFSGHLHLPHFFPNSVIKNDELGGTTFVHISSIRPEIWDLKKSESRVLTFFCDSSDSLLRARDHKGHNFENEYEIMIKLSKKYECNYSQ